MKLVRSVFTAKRFKHDKISPGSDADRYQNMAVSNHELPIDMDQKRRQIKSIWMALNELGEPGIPSSIEYEKAWDRLDRCQTSLDVVNTLR